MIVVICWLLVLGVSSGWFGWLIVLLIWFVFYVI